ncbi:MAG: anti-sigma factor [Burkholderiaceae bacterium]|nr:anti-sigma factor [Burkholderiaceae bacterium]
MDISPSETLTEDQIHALVDGQLSPQEAARLQARLTLDPVAQVTVEKWRQQRAALKSLHGHILSEALPATLTTTATQSAASQQALNQWWRWGGIAAGVMMTFGVGWFSNAAWHGESQALAPTAAVVKALSARDFARQASLAHAVYAPEARHPVEVAAAEQEHLIQWLSKRLGKPLKVPNLTAQGYQLVGGRLLPGDAGARAQFMFQKESGARITLYLGAVDKAPTGAAVAETGFNFASEGAISSFYWIDQGFGYALVGPVPRDSLMKLAQAVYQQL